MRLRPVEISRKRKTELEENVSEMEKSVPSAYQHADISRECSNTVGGGIYIIDEK